MAFSEAGQTTFDPVTERSRRRLGKHLSKQLFVYTFELRLRLLEQNTPLSRRQQAAVANSSDAALKELKAACGPAGFDSALRPGTENAADSRFCDSSDVDWWAASEPSSAGPDTFSGNTAALRGQKTFEEV